MLLKIKCFPAKEGDSFFIKINDKKKFSKNILIDGGNKNKSTTEILKEIDLLEKENEKIDLLILTHIDRDHIHGIIKLYQNEKFNPNVVKEVWFNSGKLLKNEFNMKIDKEFVEIPINSTSKMKSFSDGNTFENLLIESGSWEQCVISEGYKFSILDNINITVLSPSIIALNELSMEWEKYENNLYEKSTGNSKNKSSEENDYGESVENLLNNKFKNDISKKNLSSIAFLLEINSTKILMTSDANPLQLEKALKKLGYSSKNKLKLDLFKIPHHGSKYNSTLDLVDLIDCENYLISTDGSKNNHPHKEALVKYLKEDKNTNFYFNYNEVIEKRIFTDSEIEKYNISLIDLSVENHHGEKWVWEKLIR